MEWYAVAKSSEESFSLQGVPIGDPRGEEVVFVGTREACSEEIGKLSAQNYDEDGVWKPFSSQYSIKRVYVSFSPSH